jgi:predicted RNA binding protein YcfA (HicA-like mRNA interferase family)
MLLVPELRLDERVRVNYRKTPVRWQPAGVAQVVTLFHLARLILSGGGAMKVREVLKELREDGWVVVRVKGSHRQLRHPNKPGTETVAGKESLEVPRGTLNSILKQSGLKQ